MSENVLNMKLCLFFISCLESLNKYFRFIEVADVGINKLEEIWKFHILRKIFWKHKISSKNLREKSEKFMGSSLDTADLFWKVYENLQLGFGWESRSFQGAQTRPDFHFDILVNFADFHEKIKYYIFVDFCLIFMSFKAFYNIISNII